MGDSEGHGHDFYVMLTWSPGVPPKFMSDRDFT